MKVRMCLIILGLVTTTVRADTVDDQARFLISKSGISKGICSVPFEIDGKLAMSLASNSELLVHAVVDNQKHLRLIRDELRSKDLLGKRVYVDQGHKSQMAFADNYVDLMVVANADVLNATATELLRAIRPLGLLMVQVSNDEAELRQWLGDASDKVTNIKNADDQWLMIRKPEPDGIAEWPYWYGDSGNNPNSNDTLIGDSHMVQWLGLPYYTTCEIISVVAGGRVFNILGGNVAFPFSSISPNKVEVRNIYNGTVLWSAPVPENFYALRSAFAATKDTFYLLDGNQCLLYDAATGNLKETIKIGNPDEMLQWMALDGDKLVALAGPKVKYSPRGKTYASPTPVDQEQSPWVFGHRFYGYDLRKQTIVWQHEDDKPIDALATGLSNGRVFYYAHGSHRTALDTKTGDKLWTNRDEKLFGETYKTTKLSFAQIRSGFCNMLCNDDYVFLDPATKRMLSAFDAKTGKLLWTEPRGQSRFTCKMLYSDGKLLTNNVASGSRVVEFDPRSGKQSATKVSAAACTRITACNGKIFTRNSFNPRATCVEGVIPASGMLYMSAYACGCNYQLLGYQALATGKPELAEYAKSATNRLQILGRDLLSFNGPAAEPSDWPIYRADASHSSSSLVSVCAAVSQRWKSKPSQSSRPTPPIAVRSRIYIGGDDGSLRCIDTKTGNEIWQSFTDGPIMAAPTYWQGSIYVGSGDGFVYRFEATSDECIWRFRVAPRERLIRVYGSLSSTWPVHSGVLIHNGTAFAAAGITHLNGTAVVAFDPKSGVMQWENLTSGDSLKVSAQGSLIGIGEEIVLAGGRSASAVAFDESTGNITRRFSAGLRGKEIGLLGGKTLIYGGRPMFSPEELPRASGKSDSIRLIDLAPKAKPVSLGRRNSLFPVWDDDVFVHSQSAFNGLVARFRREADDTKLDAKPQQDKEAHWGPVAGQFPTIAVAKNVIIAVQLEANKRNAYRLAAFSKQDAKLLWSTPLDSKPKLDGLAIDRSGNIVVALDGGEVCLFSKAE